MSVVYVQIGTLRCSWAPGEGLRWCGPGVIDNCELPSLGAEHPSSHLRNHLTSANYHSSHRNYFEKN